MFGTRRLAKRSIIGTRVCAAWEDGRYRPGFIQSTQTWPNGEEVYSIRFNGGYSKTYTGNDIIGPGYQSITTAVLKRGQKVYITLNGREVAGTISHHETDAEEVEIYVEDSLGEEHEVCRKLDEVRLTESRKSPRLQDQDTDYCRLADIQIHSNESKKRTVSHVIDVPGPAPKHSRRRKSLSPDPEVEDMTCDEPKPEEMGDIMDEHMAAMVLTSLSCSPVSPGLPTAMQETGVSPARSSSTGSSGIWGVKSEPNTPSPIQNNPLRHSVRSSTVFGSLPPDEGIDLDETGTYFSEETTPVQEEASKRTVFKCTWPGCGKIYNTCPGIEQHVRQNHLGTKDEGDYDLSDHEEEFYYTEIEVTIDTVTQTFADMYTSSPPQLSPMEGNKAMSTSSPAQPMSITDHDYQKKEHRSAPQNIPHKRHNGDHPQGASYPISLPVTIPPLSGSLSWQSTSGSKLKSQSPKTHHFMSSSPKNSSPMHKKCRSEVKKCRKVYGMENRDLWCTQCKWKKACSRFLE